MHFKDVAFKINQVLPFDKALASDKVGVQVATTRKKITNALVTLEVNDAVLEECIAKNIDLVITFHPLIYRPIESFDFDERVAKLTSLFLKNDIGLISIHTAFDVNKSGSNFILADLLDLKNISFLKPHSGDTEFGMGVIGQTKKTISLEKFLQKIEAVFLSPIRYCQGKSDKINTIAIVGGSGSSYIEDAIKNNCDAYITADLTYHMFHRCSNIINLIDIGHYEMEQFVPVYLARLLQKIIPKVNFIQTNSYTNPVCYYPAFDYREKQIDFITK